ncbi:MAG TPA: hypothetical protein VK449_11580 [Anaerolineales bacterium]|nr:hypothetical protein [Anaerolineales bacterium]
MDRLLALALKSLAEADTARALQIVALVEEVWPEASRGPYAALIRTIREGALKPQPP